MPLRIDRLNVAVAQALETATGAVVKFDGSRSRLDLAKHAYEVRGLAIYADGRDSDPALSFDRAEVIFGSWSALARAARGQPFDPEAGYPVDQIEVRGVSPIRYSAGPSGVNPGPAAEMLARIASRSRVRDGAARQPLLNRIVFFDTEITCDIDATSAPMASSSDDSTPRDPANRLALRGDLKLRFSDSGSAVEFRGALVTERNRSASRIDLLWSAEGRCGGNIKLEQPAFVLPLPSGPVEISAPHGIDAGFRMTGETSAPTFSGNLAIPEFRLESAAVDAGPPNINGGLEVTGFRPIVISDRNLDLTAGDISFDRASGRLRIGSAGFASDLVATSLSLALDTGPARAFDAEATATRLGGGWRDLVTQLLPAGYTLDAPADAFRLHAAASRAEGSPTTFSGSLAFTSASLVSPVLPAPLKGLAGEIALLDDRIEVRRLRGRMGRTSLGLDGALTGDYLGGGEGLLSLAWETRIDLAEAAEALNMELERTRDALPPEQRGERIDQLEARGVVTGQGTLSHRLSLRRPLAADSVPDLQGSMKLFDVSLAHPVIPGRIEAMAGDVTVRDSTLVMACSGQFRGSPVQLRGLVAGQGAFWNEPELTATLTASFDVDKLAAALEPGPRDTMMKTWAAKGSADAAVRIVAGLGSERYARASGSARLDGIEFQVPGAPAPLKVRAGQGTLSWDGKTVAATDLSATVNGQPLAGSARIDRDGLAAALTGDIDMKSVQAMLPPKTGQIVEMSGDAALDLKLEIPATRQNRPGPGAPDLVEWARARMLEEAAALFPSLTGTFTVGPPGRRAGRLRHDAMPPGGDGMVAADANDIRGRMVIRDRTLSAVKQSALRCDLADTKGCDIWGSLQWRPGDFPKIALAASTKSRARFDTWLGRWGGKLDMPDNPPDTGKTMELTFDFDAPSAVYRGLEAGAVDVRLAYTLEQRIGKPRRTEFKRVRVRGANGGTLEATGDILAYPWKPDSYPRWNADFRLDRMDLRPVLGWVFRDVKNIDGLGSGRVNVQGVKADGASVTGSGSLSLGNLFIDRTPLIQRLGQVARSQAQQGLSYESVQATEFSFADGSLRSVRPLRLRSQRGLELEMSGRYQFAPSRTSRVAVRSIDAVVKTNIFESVLRGLPIVGAVPLVGEIAGAATRIVDRTAGSVLTVQVTGDIGDPRLTLNAGLPFRDQSR